MVIDAQIHAWAADSGELPWIIKTHSKELDVAARKHFAHDVYTSERVIEAMNAVGVDAAIFVNSNIYGGDLTYALAAADLYPGRFALVNPILPELEDVPNLITGWASSPHLVGIRFSAYTDHAIAALLGDESNGDIIDTAGAKNLVVNLYTPGYLPDVAVLLERFPHVQFVVDHLGLLQPPLLTTALDAPFAGVDDLVALARYPNVAVKATAVPSLSKEGFPFRDVWPHLDRVVGAFGVERVMWGADFTRVASMLTYAQGIDYVRELPGLSDSDRTALLGGSAERIYGWFPS